MSWKRDIARKAEREKAEYAKIRLQERLHAAFWGKDYDLKETVARVNRQIADQQTHRVNQMQAEIKELLNQQEEMK